jgi:hypothetical protein
LNESAQFNSSDWTPFCFTKNWYGSWRFYLRGHKVKSGIDFKKDLKFQDGSSLIIGQKVDDQRSGIHAASGFVGHLTQLSIWPTDLEEKKLSSYAGGCSENYGAIPWPEAYLWIHGSIRKYDLYICKSFKGKRFHMLAHDI